MQWTVVYHPAFDPEYEALPKDAYTPDENTRVYAEMFALAGRTLEAGQAVSLDATFREPVWRAQAEDLARAAGVVFDGRWLDLPVEVRRARVEARLKDVSDATSEIAAAQADIDKSTVSWQIDHA